MEANSTVVTPAPANGAVTSTEAVAGATGTAQAPVLRWSDLTVAAVDKWLEARGEGMPRIIPIDNNGVTLKDAIGGKRLYAEPDAPSKLAHYLVSRKMANDARVDKPWNDARYILTSKSGVPASVFDSVPRARKSSKSETTAPAPAPVVKTLTEQLTDAKTSLEHWTAEVKRLSDAVAAEERQRKLDAMIAEEEAAIKAEARKRAEARLAALEAAPAPEKPAPTKGK